MCKIFLLIVSFFLIYGLSHAQPIADAPTPKELALVRIKTCETKHYIREDWKCRVREFVEEKDGKFLFRTHYESTGRSSVAEFTPHLSTVRTGSTRYSPHTFFLQFPLKAGAGWSGTYTRNRQGSEITRTRSAEVVGYGPITLKIGNVDAYEIRTFNQLHTASSPAEERYWYCPSIGAVCRYESPSFDIYYEVVDVQKK